jgi:hypothetical protein
VRGSEWGLNAPRYREAHLTLPAAEREFRSRFWQSPFQSSVGLGFEIWNLGFQGEALPEYFPGLPAKPKKPVLVTANRLNEAEHSRMATLRDTGPYSTRNTSKGAMIEETGRVFGALTDGMTVDEVREAVLTGTLLPHASRTNRAAVRDRIHYRYLTHRVSWILSSLTDAYRRGPRSPEFVSLC